jgi:hypothetical protein
VGFVDCIIACLNGEPDAGVPPQTIQECAMLCGPSYTMEAQQEGQALISCLASSCDTQATCGGQ